MIKPALRTARRFLLFLLITWTIINSALLTKVIYLIVRGHLSYAKELFLGIYCLRRPAGSLLSIYMYIHLDIFVVTPGIVILWLWWRKQTILRASLLATFGAFGSPSILAYARADTSTFIALTATPFFYGALAFFNSYRKELMPWLHLPEILTWQRPWLETGAHKENLNIEAVQN